MRDRHRGNAGQRAKRAGDGLHDAAVDIVERVAQRHHRLGVAGNAQLAREEKRIAIERAVDQAEKVEERARDPCMRAGRLVAAAGHQLRRFRPRLEEQHEGKIERIDEESLLCVRPEPQEDIRLTACDLCADETENGLQEREREEAQERNERDAIGYRSKHAVSLQAHRAGGNGGRRRVE